MEELRPGLWTWTAPHPDWKPEDGGPDGWEREVRSYVYDAGNALVVFDPISPPAAVEDLALGQSVVVMLTVPWHQRSADELHTRHGARVYAPAPGDDEMRVPVRTYAGVEMLPGKVEPRPGSYDDEAVLWVPEHRALVTGDVVLGTPGGLRLQPDAWLPEGLTSPQLRERLRPLLDLPVELVLPTHGDPITLDARDALARALAA